MRSKENGLTVGELTITISALIVAALIWTTISRKEESKSVFNIYSQPSLAETTQKNLLI